MSEVPGQSGHALPNLLQPICAKLGNRPSALAAAFIVDCRAVDFPGLRGRQLIGLIECDTDSKARASDNTTW